MVNFSPNNPYVHITDGVIEAIENDSRNTLITVTYTNRMGNRRNEERIRLVVSRNTTILDERGRTIPVRDLEVGMVINAVVSSAMTRSIPPQANAFLIRVVRRPLANNMIATGRILEINQQNRSFTMIRDGNLSSIIRFNVPENAIILDRNGRPIPFSRLIPGLRVRVRHAAFMTASIPPQTTAFEIRVL